MSKLSLAGLGAALVAVAVLVIVLRGGGGGGATTATTASTRACVASVGIMAPATGPAAQQGLEQIHFAQLAVDQFNRRNGTRITAVQGDTQLDPGQASTVAQQFISNDKIVAIIGPAGSQEVSAIGPLLTRAKMPAVSQSATEPSLTTSGKYPTFSRVVPPDSVQGTTDARFMIDRLKVKRVVIVDDQTSYSTGLSVAVQRELQRAGVTVQRESISQSQTDFSSVVSKIPGNAGLVLLDWQLAAKGQRFGKQMQEQGKKVTIFGTDGLFSPADFSIEGSYVSTFAPDIKAIPADAGIVKAFRARYGDFGTFGPPTYAAATVVLSAIQRVCRSGAQPTRAAVGAAIKQTNMPTSVLGQPIVFDRNGDLRGAKFFIFRINGGKYVLVR